MGAPGGDGASTSRSSHCSQCQRRVQGRHVLQTSVGRAGCAAGVQLDSSRGRCAGRRAAHGAGGAARRWRTAADHVRPAGHAGRLAHVLHRAARAAAPGTELCEQVRERAEAWSEFGRTSDRLAPAAIATGCGFTTPDTTSLRDLPRPRVRRRGHGAGDRLRRRARRDGWAPYRCYDGLHQTCLNHLLRTLQAPPGGSWPEQVPGPPRCRRSCRGCRPRPVRDRCNAGELSEHGMVTPAADSTPRLARLDAPPPLDDAERFAAHLANEFPAVFLNAPVGPVARRHPVCAEQAIRPAVASEGVRGGNRTRHGATPIRCSPASCDSARQRGPRPASGDRRAVARGPEPAVPELLGLPPPTA